MFYVVKRGIVPGIYDTWEECKEQVYKFPNAEFKKFTTYQQAREYFDKSKYKITKLDNFFKVTKDNINTVPTKPAPKQSIDLNDGNIINIYTDGSCINNGKKNAKGGVGVFFNHTDARNVSMKLNVARPTNQLAELTAISMALDIIQSELGKKSIYIYTDSLYSIKCIKNFSPAWERSKWKKKDGSEIKNLEVIQKIYRIDKVYKINFVHIRAHTNKQDVHSIGNRFADELAYNGAIG